MPVPWMDRAACRTVDPDLFGPPEGAQDRARTAAALAVCAACPVVAPCLDDAMRLHDVGAIRGGLTGYERARIRRQQRAATAGRGSERL